MKRNLLIGLLVVSLLSTIVFGVGAAETATLRFAAGGMGGGWYTIAAGLMQLVSEKDPTIKIDVVPGAGMGNCSRVGIGEVDMALSQTAMNKLAFDGVEPYTEPYPDIRGGYKGFGAGACTFFVTKDTGLESFDDLINQKYPIDLVIEGGGSAVPIFYSRILEFYGVDFATIEEWGGSVKFVGYDDQIAYMKDRHANAIVKTTFPDPSIQEIAFSKIDLRMLKYSDELRKYMTDKYSFRDCVVPKDSYDFLEEDIIVPATDTCLIFNKNAPEDVVYRFIKIICENAERVKSISPLLADNFNPSQLGAIGIGVPLHPGAEKYYKEIGWIK